MELYFQQVSSHNKSVKNLPNDTIRREENMVKSLFLTRHCIGNSGFIITIPTFPLRRVENNLSCNKKVSSLIYYYIRKNEDKKIENNR